MEKTAIENLKLVKKILDGLEIPFCLEAGTLLLAYRDKKIDTSDIDVTVLDIQKVIDNIDHFLGEFEVVAVYNHPLVPEITLKRKGIRLDIWTKRFRDEEAWWCSFAAKPIPHHVPEKHFKTFDKYEIWGVEWNIPHCVEEYLERAYGDWRVPNPDWRWDVDPKCIDYSWRIDI